VLNLVDQLQRRPSGGRSEDGGAENARNNDMVGKCKEGKYKERNCKEMGEPGLR